MKNVVKIAFTGILSIFLMFSYAQEDIKMTKKEQKKAEKKKLKEEQVAKEEADWLLFQQLAANRRFVVEFDKVTDTKSGQQYVLSSRINFVAVVGDRVVIQVQTHPYLSNNGLGGVTIDGTINNYKFVLPKNDKSPIVINFNVSSELTFRGSNVRITVTEGGNATISLGASPNIYGRFVEPEKSNINVGVRMWN